MSKIDHQALREAAVKATWGDWDSYKPHRGARGYEVRLSSQAIAQHVLKNNAEFIAAFNPKVALALLDERERNRQYIKRRDQENEDIALTVGKLRVEREAAKKRIAELEAELVSQTYKLNELSGNSPVTPDGWISCSERMPEMGERQCYVLAADFKNNYPPNIPNTQVGVYGDWFNDGNPTWDDGDGEDLYLKEVTHWMPLPEPPQEAK
ncbi:TPA: ead/Ea22-like family protein [Escherichia coli]|nr:ead/Ea22-like family protein [Escherichia coli]MCE3759446.1 ead/Ea22-like family protein [Escherichia coli]HCP0187098.1 ead/Ea22-like family protein [Escherichia coli]HCX7430957.1 ead/Ea22-like family protein [Escherichia coli]